MTPEQTAQAAANASRAMNMPHPLRRMCNEWLEKIAIADKVKHELFGQYAKEASNFFDGPHDYMWQMARDPISSPTANSGFLDKSAPFPRFRMSVNKIFDAVAVFGPSMYYQNPVFTVDHIKKPIPAPEAFPGVDPNMVMQMIQLQMQEEIGKASVSEYLESYANWLIREGGLREHANNIITEALVKGLGCAWIELYETPDGSIRYPKATYMSCDDLLVDPDANCWDDVQWIARRRREAVNLVERKFSLPPGVLQGQRKTASQQASEQSYSPAVDGPRKVDGSSNGKSFDLIEYYEIYSKNGFGGRLKRSVGGGTSQYVPMNTLDEEVDMEWVGDYARIVVSPGIPFPLNAPSWALQDAQGLEQAVSWPTPFYVDQNLAGGWPLVRFAFYEKPNSVWPISIFKPVVGPLRFVNWILSFLADKVAASCTTYVVTPKSVAMEFKSQLETGSLPFSKIEIGSDLAQDMDKLVKFIDAEAITESVWMMAEKAMELIDKTTGLTELVYGLSSRQMRSAAEANNKQQSVSVRPDDMANKVESALGTLGMKLITCARWNLSGQDVIGPLGELGASIWDTSVVQDQFDSIVRDYCYTVEAGSARKRNKAEQAAKIQEFGQVALPIYQQYMMATGDMNPMNAYITAWCKANDLSADGFTLSMPLPPPQPPQQGQSENGQNNPSQTQPEGDQQASAAGAFVG